MLFLDHTAQVLSMNWKISEVPLSSDFILMIAKLMGIYSQMILPLQIQKWLQRTKKLREFLEN